MSLNGRCDQKKITRPEQACNPNSQNIAPGFFHFEKNLS